MTTNAVQKEEMTIQLKATEQYFYVGLCIMLHKALLTFKSVDVTLVCDHSNETYYAVLYVVLFIMLDKVVL